MNCPQCKRKMIYGNVKGYYTCNRCKIFLYISITQFPAITSGMPLNAVTSKTKQKRKK